MYDRGYIVFGEAKTISGFRIASAPYFNISKVDANPDVIVDAIKGSLCNDDDTIVPNPTDFKQSGKDFLKNIGLKSMRELDDRSNKYVSIKDDGIQITFTPLRPADKPDKGFVNFKNSESFAVSLTASNQEIMEAYESALSKCG